MIPPLKLRLFTFVGESSDAKGSAPTCYRIQALQRHRFFVSFLASEHVLT